MSGPQPYQFSRELKITNTKHKKWNREHSGDCDMSLSALLDQNQDPSEANRSEEGKVNKARN